MSGALRPPQSPQNFQETSLTSLWQPHRKVKQRGSKVRVSGPFLGGRCAAGHKTHPSRPPFVSFPGFPLTRVADSVCTWWDHAFKGSRSPWPTTRAPTPELANSRYALVQSVYRQGRCLRRAHCGSRVRLPWYEFNVGLYDDSAVLDSQVRFFSVESRL